MSGRVGGHGHFGLPSLRGLTSLFGHVAIATLMLAAPGKSECHPSGQVQFADGLEALSRGDLNAANQALTALVRAQPECAEARNNLAAVLVEQGRLADASEQLRQALRIRPDYQRARFNLQRVENLLAARAVTTPGSAAVEREMIPVAPTAIPSSTTMAPPATIAAPTSVPTTAVATASFTATRFDPLRTPTEPPLSPTTTRTAISPAQAPREVPAKPALPSLIAALEPEGQVACVLFPQQRRLCLYRRLAQQTAADRCYAIVTWQVGSWPGFVVLTESSAHRIWLADERGERRFKIIPGEGTSAHDVIGLRKADYDALTRTLKRGRTACVSAEEPNVQADQASAIAAEVRQSIERWRQAWEQKQLDQYFAQYSTTFIPEKEADVQVWRDRKRSLFQQGGSLSIQLSLPSIFVVERGAAVVSLFEQLYRSGAQTTRSFKLLRWQREADGWRINVETLLHESPL